MEEIAEKLKSLGATDVRSISEIDTHIAVDGLTLHFSELEEFEEETGFDVCGFTEYGTVFMKER